MKKILNNISNYDINIKKNYKIIRMIGKIFNPDVFYKNNYEDLFLNIGQRQIRIRVFRPSNNNFKRKVIIFIHGGGWVIGSLESYTKPCIELAKLTNRVVISVDYRLAPEHKFPSGFNDCYDVVNLIMNNLNEIGLKKDDVCLMGDSAGANLVAAISIKSQKTKDFKIKEQILLYPAVQTDYSDNTKFKSIIEKGKDYILTQKRIQDFMSLYVEKPEDLHNVYIAPLKAKTLFSQPRTLLITAENDPLRDEGKCYARKLKLFLNDVTYYNVEGAMHGFLNLPLGKEYKVKAFDKIKQYLGDDDE